MSCVLVIDCSLVFEGTPAPPFICKGCGVPRKVTESVTYNDPYSDSISSCLITRYISNLLQAKIFFPCASRLGLPSRCSTWAESFGIPRWAFPSQLGQGPMVSILVSSPRVLGS